MPRPRIGSIQEDKDGNVYVRASYKDADGNRHYPRRRAENRTHARIVLQELLKEIEQKLSRPTGARSSFQELADWYETTQAIDPVIVDDNKVAGLRGKRTVLYRLRLLCQAFGDAPLDSITYDQIKRYKLTRLQQKTPRGTYLKLSSIHRELALLRRLFQLAVQRDWLAKNPFFSGEALITKSHERRRKRILSLAEETGLLIHCRDFRAHMEGILMAATDTGMRKGELFSLRWPDVNIPKREITVRALNTKTLHQRVAPISNRLARVLRWRWQNRQSEDELVFGVSKSISTSWKTLCRLADVKEIRFHDLRHTFASRMTAEGIHPFVIALIMGHSVEGNALAMTYSYTHLTKEVMEQVISALDRIEGRRIREAQGEIATNASHIR